MASTEGYNSERRVLKREVRKLRRDLRDLVAVVAKFLVLLDAEMKLPSSPQRGQRLAHLANELDMARQQAERFGLGRPLKGEQRKPIAGQHEHDPKVARARGEEAARRCVPMKDQNPYSESSQLGRAWVAGWLKETKRKLAAAMPKRSEGA